MERGDAAGISEFVLLPVAIKPDHTRSINNFVLEEVKENSRFYAFGTIHAEMDNILEEVEYIAQNGLLGIKMHPDTQRFNIDDERLFPVYDMIGDKIPVLFHTGDKHFDYSHPARLRKVIDMFPKLEVIAAHFGGWSMFDTAYECLKDTNCMMDISSSISFMEKGQPEKLINSYGADRLLFGSDYPVWDPAKEVEKFLQLNIKDEDKEKIAYKNALKLLKRY
jgi:predicted TIM-barrel fold metal-dependent hydrolase